MRGLFICNLVPIKRRVPIYSRPIKFKRSHAGGNCEVNEIVFNYYGYFKRDVFAKLFKNIGQ